MRPDSDLLLLAFRYISDEMAPHERDEFERRLTSDVVACDAVADAVLLHDATLAVGAQSVAPRASEMVSPVRRNSTSQTTSAHFATQRGAFIAVALTVSLGLMLSSIALWPGTNDDIVSSQIASLDHDDINVAEVWSDLSSVVIEDGDSHMEEDDLTMDDSESISSIPDWMFAVVDAAEVDDSVMMDPVEMNMEQAETL